MLPVAPCAAANILLEPSCTPEMRVELCDMQSMVQLPCATEDPAAKQQVKDTPMTGRCGADRCRTTTIR